MKKKNSGTNKSKRWFLRYLKLLFLKYGFGSAPDMMRYKLWWVVLPQGGGGAIRRNRKS